MPMGPENLLPGVYAPRLARDIFGPMTEIQQNGGFFGLLEKRAKDIDSLLCVGLDPDIGPGAGPIGRRILEENKRIIEATARLCCAYKPNIAFYESHGIEGMEALELSLREIPGEIPIILDAKRGDIGNTAKAYARAAFEVLGVGAITLSPYMGRDSIEPFLAYRDRGVFVLARTSNPGARDLQDLACGNDGRPLYLQVAATCYGYDPERVGLVVAGNDYTALARLRTELPGAWFLSPGIGAQGGEAELAARAGLRRDGMGVLAVVVRAIAQAANPGAEAHTQVEALRRARDRALRP